MPATSPLVPLTPRSVLERLHRDLFTIDRCVRSDISDAPLSVVEQMVLVLEDRRFFHHRGVDLRSCVREVVRTLLLRSHGGASTIDMQFVRTATGYRDRTIKRKLYEMLLSILVQFRYSKLEIFRSYLSCAFFGSHLIGIEAAAREIFQKAPESLNVDEAAYIASLLVYPRPLRSTSQWTLKVDRRANYGKRLFPRLKKAFEKLPIGEQL